MFKMARQRPRKCKFVEGFGENARRCQNVLASDQGEGDTHCYEHKWHQAQNANNHPGKIEEEQDSD